MTKETDIAPSPMLQHNGRNITPDEMLKLLEKGERVIAADAGPTDFIELTEFGGRCVEVTRPADKEGNARFLVYSFDGDPDFLVNQKSRFPLGGFEYVPSTTNI